MSPKGREPEAGLCLPAPSTIGRDQAGGQTPGLLWQGSAQGHLLAVTQAVGVCSQFHGPTAGPCVQTYLHIYQ